MKIQNMLAGLAAVLLAAAPSWPAQWFTVGGPDDPASGPLVEVDLETLAPGARGGEAVIRVSHAAPRAHEDGFVYRSFVGNAQFDCQRRAVSLASAAFYPLPRGQGERLGARSTGSAAGMPAALLETIPAGRRRALLRASCATAQPPS